MNPPPDDSQSPAPPAPEDEPAYPALSEEGLYPPAGLAYPVPPEEGQAPAASFEPFAPADDELTLPLGFDYAAPTEAEGAAPVEYIYAAPAEGELTLPPGFDYAAAPEAGPTAPAGYVDAAPAEGELTLPPGFDYAAAPEAEGAALVGHVDAAPAQDELTLPPGFDYDAAVGSETPGVEYPYAAPAEGELKLPAGFDYDAPVEEEYLAVPPEFAEFTPVGEEALTAPAVGEPFPLIAPSVPDDLAHPYGTDFAAFEAGFGLPPETAPEARPAVPSVPPAPGIELAHEPLPSARQPPPNVPDDQVALLCEGLERFLGAEEARVHVLRGVSLRLEPGFVHAVVGPSGCGKSSLLYILGLLDRPDAGRLVISGQPVANLPDDELSRQRNALLGFIFQFHFLLQDFTALENIMIPMRQLGVLDETQMRERAHHLLDGVGLGEKSHRPSRHLSGGEQQRVAIARALANDPQVILADEPTGNLDTANSTRVFSLLTDLVHRENKALLLVTHNPGIADACDWVHTMRDGLIVDQQFVGRM